MAYKTLGQSLPKSWREKILKFSKSKGLKKAQKKLKPYLTGKELKKTAKGKFRSLMEKLRKKK